VSFRPIPQDPTVCHVEVLAGPLDRSNPEGRTRKKRNAQITTSMFHP